ncbi:MAG: aromatic ring-hydroxylating dioxygenase subunit alpha [Hyphomicrobiales bacterium]|nr:aromatic ring-hydroxylating dioxygenase subunit alpha [Hyphomicrobiales bacterium]
MWIRNAWYAAGWASELKAGQPLARTFLDEPVVLYRKQDGGAVAMEDRCCHRLAPLSLGRIEGDCIRCMYHGLKFDPFGQCVDIPGQDNIPQGMQVRTLPLVEKQKLLWIWLGDPALAREEDILDWPYLDSPDWEYKEDYLHYDANYLLIVDNLLDFSHLAFVHENTIGSMSLAETEPRMERTPHGIKMYRILDNDIPPQFVKNLRGNEDRVDRWNIYDWYVRGNILAMDSGFVSPGTGGHQGERKDAIQFRHLSVQTPETARTTHYFFGQPRNFGLGRPELTETIHQTVLTAFHEDKLIIEAQQKIIDANPDAPMKAITHDAGVFQARRLISGLLEEPVS